MANRDDLGFIFTFSQILVSIAEAAKQKLDRIPPEILTWIIVLVGIGCVVALVFRCTMKKKAPIQIGPIKIPFWPIPAIGCMVIVLALLFL